MDEYLSDMIARRRAVLDEVRLLLIEKLHIRVAPDEIDPDTPLFGAGLALDSIDAVDMLVHLKADFDVALPDEAQGRAMLRTVNSLVDLVLESRDRQP